MSSISTHVLDTTHGRPVAGIPVTLEFQGSDRKWKQVGHGLTDSDGRLGNLLDSGAALVEGVYRLTFDVESYQPGFYPNIVVLFRVDNPEEHYHIPLLLGKFGYTTYRGT
ncbi:MAG: hydroxyisourate hydrolase [Acidobacteria bacterium]|nr:MAG: hydroxyisourate hydrolase [Acidobacteriota bacterium]